MITILLAEPRGFCAGVRRAIGIVETALAQFGAPIYVRHAIVHNENVQQELKIKGACFIECLSQVPIGSRVIFSAHGTPPEVLVEAKNRKLKVFDAVCPLVKKVHQEIRNASREDKTVILLGHKAHQEVIGSRAQYDSRKGSLICVGSLLEIEALHFPEKTELCYVTQTTLSTIETQEWIARLKEKFPDIKGPRKEDICYASTNRQAAVRLLAKQCHFILVVGSTTSSNANRLVETARASGVPAELVTNGNLPLNMPIYSGMTIGLTAAASTPASCVGQVLKKLNKLGPCQIERMAPVKEPQNFPVELNWTDFSLVI